MWMMLIPFIETGAIITESYEVPNPKLDLLFRSNSIPNISIPRPNYRPFLIIWPLHSVPMKSFSWIIITFIIASTFSLKSFSSFPLILPRTDMHYVNEYLISLNKFYSLSLLISTNSFSFLSTIIPTSSIFFFLCKP